jgi:hypothetical protein
MSVVRRLPSGRVTADFFTPSYRFSATVLVYKRRLIDVLTDRMTDYLDLVDIYVSRVNNPGDIVATYPKGSIVKQEIVFILLPDEVEGTSKERHFGTRDLFSIFVTVPSFEIKGQLQWGSNDLDIKKLLAGEGNSFLPLLEVSAANSLFPQVVFQGPLALVNKAKIQVLCGT